MAPFATGSQRTQQWDAAIVPPPNEISVYWVESVYLAIHRDAIARKYYDHLLRVGCDSWFLFEFLRAYTETQYTEYSRLRATAREARGNAEQSKRAISQLLEILGRLRSNRLLQLYMGDRCPQLVNILESCLRAILKETDLWAFVMSKKADKRGPFRKEQALVIFVNYLRAVTGKPRFAALAHLIQVAYDTVGIESSVDSENLAKLYKLYKENHPEFASAMCDLDAWEFFPVAN